MFQRYDRTVNSDICDVRNGSANCQHGEKGRLTLRGSKEDENEEENGEFVDVGLSLEQNDVSMKLQSSVE